MDVLGVAPLLGRGFTHQEDSPGGRRVVLISESLWRQRFGADQRILEKPINVNGVSLEVIGVMPNRASFPESTRLWLALQGNPNQTGSPNYTYSGIGRLKDGVSIDDAAEDLRRAHSSIWEARDKERIVSPLVKPLREQFVGKLRPAAEALTTAVGLLLLVASCNVAVVMLARSAGRRKEMSIRLALGASRGRLLRQVVIESLITGCAGALSGLLLAHGLLQVVLATAGSQ